MTQLTWTQYQQMMEKQHQKIDKLVNKYANNPTHVHAHKWKQIILDSGLYDEIDLEYMVEMYKVLGKLPYTVVAKQQKTDEITTRGFIVDLDHNP